MPTSQPAPETRTERPPAARTLPREPPAALGAPWDGFWPLEPKIDFLNHGSFGSVPRPVREAREAWSARLEARPIELIGRRIRELLRASADRVAGFLGADSDGFGFVTNATEAVNCVLRSLPLRPGDIVVTTDHAYNAVRRTIEYVVGRAGAELRVVPLSAPLGTSESIASQVVAALDPRVRAIVIDHVTSPTAAVLPVATIAAACRERGVFCLVDGAHAPGMLPIRIASIGADAYAGNLHKWVCAPKGSGFLWVDRRHRDAVHPATISHFLDQGYSQEFDWQGTRDFSAWLATTAAIDLWEELGWNRLREHNGRLARWAERLLAERWSVDPVVSDHSSEESAIRSMATVPLPAAIARRFANAEAFQALLYDEHAIEVPIIDWSGRWHVRVSCQAYNRPSQYERLAEVVRRIAD